MEHIPAYNWAGHLTRATSRTLVLALSHCLKGAFTAMRQNPTKGASYSEIYHAQTLTLPPLIPEKGAIFCARSGVAPYPDPCLYIHTTAFAVVVCPDDLVVLNPFFVQITGRDTWITTFLVPEQITAAFAWFAQTASGERGEITQ